MSRERDVVDISDTCKARPTSIRENLTLSPVFDCTIGDDVGLVKTLEQTSGLGFNAMRDKDDTYAYVGKIKSLTICCRLISQNYIRTGVSGRYNREVEEASSTGEQRTPRG